MTSKASRQHANEHKSWYKGLLDEMVQDLLKAQVLTGVTLDASPVWMVPGKILIARVWPTLEKSRFIWAIAGDAVVPDHADGTVAVGPREAARHFSMKWQMDAEQMHRNTGQLAADNEAARAMKAHADRLIQGAELLYDLSERKEIWKPR